MALDPLIVAVDFGMAVLIWLVQLVVYPAFREIDPERFAGWHRSYRQRISLIVIPLMLGQLVLHAMGLEREVSGWGLASALAIAGAWAVTFLRSVPCHAELQREGHQSAVIESLITANWWRTALWSLAFVASLVATAAT